MGAALEFLRDTRVGCIGDVRRLPRGEGGEKGEEGEAGFNDEDGPGPS